MEKQKLQIDGELYRFKLNSMELGTNCGYEIMLHRRVFPLVWTRQDFELARNADAVVTEMRKMIDRTISPEREQEVLQEALDKIVDEYEEVSY